MRDENFHLARRLLLRSSFFILVQVFALILLIAGPGVAQSTAPTATPTPDRRTLDEARRDNEAAQADYYRAQTLKLATPDQPKTLWKRLSENAAILGALTAAFVAVFSLIINQRAALRARKDTEFYEALKRFGDKDSPTVRASAATILMEMTNTSFFAWRWRKNAPWWRPDQKMIRYPYLDTVLDQLITGLLLEDNHLVIHNIVRVLTRIMERNFNLAHDGLCGANRKLQFDIGASLTQLLVARGVTSVNADERKPYLKEAHALSQCSEEALNQIYCVVPTGLRSFKSALETFTVMDESQKHAHLMEVQRRLLNLGIRLRQNIELFCTLLSYRPEGETSILNFGWIYLEDATLTGANLQNAVFYHALMDRAFFANAKLQGASFEQTSLSATWFSGADLTNTKFARARFNKNCKFDNANWWQADFGPDSDVVLSFVIDTLFDKRITPQMVQEAHPSTKEFLKQQMKVG